MQLQCGAYGLGLSGLEVSKKVKRYKTHGAPPLTNAVRICKILNRMQKRSTCNFSSKHCSTGNYKEFNSQTQFRMRSQTYAGSVQY